jgi:hypothetical protein
VGKRQVETEIYIAAGEATHTFVEDFLRPQMYVLVPADHFPPAAMSTSFVGREIMGRATLQPDRDLLRLVQLYGGNGAERLAGQLQETDRHTER